MRNKIQNFVTIVCVMAFSFTAKSQCTVTIVPDGTDTMCAGSFIVLNAGADFPTSSSFIDQQQTNYNGGMSALTGPDRSEFQTFIAGTTGTLLQIDMGFFNFINGAGVVNLYAGNGILGALLNTQNVNINCLSGSCLISFTQNTPITAGNAYTFQFIPGAGMPNPYGVQIENPGSYNNGELFITDPSGTYPTGMDMVFATHVGQNDSLQYLWSTGATDSTILAFTDQIYSVTVTSTLCSATDSIHITVIEIDTTVSVSGNTLTAMQTIATYQWVDCDDDYADISGATNQSFSPTESSSYAVEISQFGCSITTSCFEMEDIGISETALNTAFEIFPNPSDGKFTVNNFSGRAADAQLIVENVFGQLIFEKQLSNETETTDISFLPAGTYFVFIQNDFGKAIRKIIIR